MKILRGRLGHHFTAAIFFVFTVAFSPGSVAAGQESEIDICSINQEQFVRYVNGALTGANITAYVSGSSVPLIVAEHASLVVAAPAMAIGAGYAVVTTGLTFAYLNAYCGTPHAIDLSAKLYEDAVAGTVEAIEVGAGTYEVAVQQTSVRIEKANNYRKRVIRSVSDLFCFWDSNCK